MASVIPRKGLNLRSITVYTTPICARCKVVKRWLESRGIPFSTVDLSTNPDDAAAMRALGYTEAPVIVVSNGDPETDVHWSGVNVDFLTRYCLEAAA